MDEESPAKRGDSAWKEQREAIAKKNADAHKRAQTAKNQRDATVSTAAREDAQREADQLRDLNKKIAKRRSAVASADRI